MIFYSQFMNPAAYQSIFLPAYVSYVHVYLCASVVICTSFRLYIYLSFWLSFYQSMSTFFFYIYKLTINLFLCSPVYLSSYLLSYLPACLSPYLLFYSSTNLSLYTLIYLPIYFLPLFSSSPLSLFSSFPMTSVQL